MESPGRGAGMSPDSTNTTRMRPIVPKVSMSDFGSSQLTAVITAANVRRCTQSG